MCIRFARFIISIRSRLLHIIMITIMSITIITAIIGMIRMPIMCMIIRMLALVIGEGMIRMFSLISLIRNILLMHVFFLILTRRAVFFSFVFIRLFVL